MENLQRQGICPKCGSNNLNYEGTILNGNNIGFEWDCQDCKASGIECYYMEFITHIVEEKN